MPEYCIAIIPPEGYPNQKNYSIKAVRWISVFLYWPFQGCTSVLVPYCYLFLLSVFILRFSYYVSDIFCKF